MVAAMQPAKSSKDLLIVPSVVPVRTPDAGKFLGPDGTPRRAPKNQNEAGYYADRSVYQHMDHPRGGKVFSDVQGKRVTTRTLSPGGVDLGVKKLDTKELRIAIIGDTGKADQRQMRTAAGFRKWCKDQKCHFAIHVGDMVYPSGVQSPNDPRLDTLLAHPYRGVKKYVVLGNHDHAAYGVAGDPDAVVAFAKGRRNVVMPARYYTFGYAFGDTRIKFVALDTTTLPTDPVQRAWLRDTVAKSNADRLVLVGHHPVHSHGMHGDNADMQRILKPLIKDHKVDAYLSGHEHDGQLLRGPSGVVQLVTGTGGENRSHAMGPKSVAATSAPGFAHLVLNESGGELQLISADTQQVLGRSAVRRRRRRQK